MKSYKRLIGIIFIVFVLLWFGANFLIIRENRTENRPYLVEISRAAMQMEEAEDLSEQIKQILEDSIYIKRIILCEAEDDLIASSIYDYCLKQVGNQIYRFEYEDNNSGEKTMILWVNLIFSVVLIFISAISIYFYMKIIRPFAKLENVPYELSKGNLTLNLPEEKAKYFGKFIWGTNLLRENIEARRQKELDLHREKKLLLLSLTHDIKTPLSVIKLNTQALQRGLYKEEERKQKALDAIITKVDEIEGYVSEISRASKEDFLNLEVKEEEFYLSQVIEKIKEYYRDKLSLKKIDFSVENYNDCLVSGDENRLVEVIQNLMENAIKYGDGREIRIHFDKEEGCQLITIENSGEGVAEEELIKIFDSFYRGSNSGSQSGSGLGLYICRQLMNGMNGDIFVRQDDSHFRMTLVVRMCGEV